MLTIQDLSYIHPNGETLFSNINLKANPNDKIAIIGNNGVGKTTLLKIIAGQLTASTGTLTTESKLYYVPQLSEHDQHLTVAEALGVGDKLKAFHEILNGIVSEENYELLNEDWTIEERCHDALRTWNLDNLSLSEHMERLSGGQKTSVRLAGITVHQPKLILLDEPSNHLDSPGRRLLYEFIAGSEQTLITVSHDRKLLNLLNPVCELRKNRITVYGGNYEFYTEQKQIENKALSQEIHGKTKALKNAKEKARQTRIRQHKSAAQGRNNLDKAGLPRIIANARQSSSEKSTAKIEGVHKEKIGSIQQALGRLRASCSETEPMKLKFDPSKLHRGTAVFTANEMNFHYPNKTYVWKKNLNLRIESGQRLAIQGANGSGKTTLIQLILGTIEPQMGTVHRRKSRSIYMDQEYGLIDPLLTIYQQAQVFNTTGLQEHEVKTRLNRFLFSKSDWNKTCDSLSGGERMRLILCCLNIGNQSPDIIVLDEPTNNLDIQNIEILTRVIRDYQGTLIVVSHDEAFLRQIGIERTIELLGNKN